MADGTGKLSPGNVRARSVILFILTPPDFAPRPYAFPAAALRYALPLPPTTRSHEQFIRRLTTRSRVNLSALPVREIAPPSSSTNGG